MAPVLRRPGRQRRGGGSAPRAVVTAAPGGLGTRSRSMLNPPVPGAIEAYGYETDYDRARALLTGARAVLRVGPHPAAVARLVALERSTVLPALLALR